MNAMPPKLRPQGRIKPKRKAMADARERAFHMWCYENHGCVCCEAPATVFHHLLMDTPSKRGRRDHEIGVPMNGVCHMLLHGAGSEQAYKPKVDWSSEAEKFRTVAYEVGVL